MNNVNKTLYIPLYGKAYVSNKGIILHDEKAEEIWAAEGFELKGKSKSKWLAYYMGMRSAVFDKWLETQMKNNKETTVVHIGCGMDSRILRVGTRGHNWYDVDFPKVMEERKKYYKESTEYHMVKSDVRNHQWIEQLPVTEHAVIVMEGVSMYLRLEELQALVYQLAVKFNKMNILMDCYTDFAAKASKYKNPINDVGVSVVYGMDEPKVLEKDGITFLKEHEMTPQELVNALNGWEKVVFRMVFGGMISKKMYRLYEYQK